MNRAPEQATARPPRFDHARWPQAQALRHRALLVLADDGSACLLADRAPDLLLLQAAEARLAAPVRWQQCDAAALDAWLAQGEQDGRALDALAGPGAADTVPHEPATQELTLAGLTAEASPAVRLLDAVLFDALKDGASDIHIENQPRGAEVRLRRDGVMQAMRRIDGVALAEQMVSRLKVMAELDIGERRLPQDGRFRLRSRGRDIDFRLSILVQHRSRGVVEHPLVFPTLVEQGFHQSDARLEILALFGLLYTLHSRFLRCGTGFSWGT